MHHPIRAALAAATLALVASSALADGQSPNAQTLDLDFDGGTLTELYEAVSQSLGHRPNVVIAPGLGEAPVPALSVRSVSVEEVFFAVASVNEEIDVRRPSPGTLAVAHDGPPRRGRNVRPYNVREWLEEYRIDDIVTAIQTAWEAAGPVGAAQVRFHVETDLLIVSGSGPQIGAAQEVLAELKPRQKPAPCPPASDDVPSAE